MRKFFRFVIMAMVLITVGIMSALTAMRIAIHGRETTIPNFVKLSPAEAERLASGNGLQTAIDGQFYSSDIPEGRIISQMPPPGTRVRRGWRVRLAQSLGPQRVEIPDVTGQSPRAAEINIRQRGLELGTVAEAHLPEEAADQIVAQSPPPNASGVQSPKVSVLVALGQAEPEAFVMPSFVGRPLTEASARIEEAGFKMQVLTPTASNGSPAVPNGTSPPGMVIRQSPLAGQKIDKDTLIQLEVSR